MSFLKKHKIRIRYYILYFLCLFAAFYVLTYTLINIFNNHPFGAAIIIFPSILIFIPTILLLFYPIFIWKNISFLQKLFIFPITCLAAYILTFLSFALFGGIASTLAFLFPLSAPIITFEISTFILNKYYAKKHDL